MSTIILSESLDEQAVFGLSFLVMPRPKSLIRVARGIVWKIAEDETATRVERLWAVELYLRIMERYTFKYGKKANFGKPHPRVEQLLKLMKKKTKEEDASGDERQSAANDPL